MVLQSALLAAPDLGMVLLILETIYMVLVWRNPIPYLRNYQIKRCMSWFRDVSDWLGGYPYEAATPGEILYFVGSRLGFCLIKQNVSNGLGVSEFLFISNYSAPL